MISSHTGTLSSRFDFVEIQLDPDEETFRQVIGIVSVQSANGDYYFIIIGIDMVEIRKSRVQTYLPYKLYRHSIEKGRRKTMSILAFDIEDIFRPTCMVPEHGQLVATTLTNRYQREHLPLYWSFPVIYMDRSNWNSLPAKDFADHIALFHNMEHEPDNFDHADHIINQPPAAHDLEYADYSEDSADTSDGQD